MVDEKQLERIALRLDGQDVPLSAEEQAVAQELHAAEEGLADLLEVEVPRGALARAERRMSAELARPGHRIRWVYGAVAAAACVLIAVGLLRTPPSSGRTDMLYQASTEQLMASLEVLDTSPEVALLKADIAELEADVRVSAHSQAEDMQLDSIEQQIDEFWLERSMLPDIEG